MNLSESEARMLTKLHKAQNAWRWYRWFLLAFGLVFGVGAMTVHEWARLLSLEYPGMVRMISQLVALTYTFSVFAGYALGTAIARWHGDPVKTLLLKLVDENEKSKSTG